MDPIKPAVFTPAEKRANCAACLLALAMRDCPLCNFFNPDTIELHAQPKIMSKSV